MQLPGPIVSTEWLAQHIDNEALRIFDVSIFLTPNDPEPGYTVVSGRNAWEANHIPGACFLDLLTEFSDQSVPLPMTMLSPEVFAERAGEAGIGNDNAVVVYAADSMMFSTRLWWMLRTIGFDNVAVLDGGWDKWQRERKPSTSAVNTYPPSSLIPKPRPGLWANRDDVLNAMQDQSVCTLNALQPEVYNGEIARYGRAGHIPGSHNVYYNSLLDPTTGAYLPLEQLRERFEVSGVMQKPRAIIYCGGGVTATMDALALTMLDHPDIAVYDGSMSEWAQDPSLPLVCGDNP
jgi:thiosulfate/3-mercaptopyruvate sulfurtransferase